MSEKVCPVCGAKNDDDWPDYLCQICWEAECDKSWWDTVEVWGKIFEKEEQYETRCI